MKTITLRVDESINDRFLWLLEHFSKEEVKILDQQDYISDDEYLRSIEGMVESIKSAKSEKGLGVKLDELD